MKEKRGRERRKTLINESEKDRDREWGRKRAIENEWEEDIERERGW